MLILFTFLLDILRVPVRVSSHGTGARTHVLTRGCARHVIAKVYASVPDGLRGALADYLGKVLSHGFTPNHLLRLMPSGWPPLPFRSP